MGEALARFVWLGSAVSLGAAGGVLAWLLFRDDLPRCWILLAGLPIVLILGQLFLSFAHDWHLPGFR
jgi:hypothetical protein